MAFNSKKCECGRRFATHIGLREHRQDENHWPPDDQSGKGRGPASDSSTRL